MKKVRNCLIALSCEWLIFIAAVIILTACNIVPRKLSEVLIIGGFYVHFLLFVPIFYAFVRKPFKILFPLYYEAWIRLLNAKNDISNMPLSPSNEYPDGFSEGDASRLKLYCKLFLLLEVLIFNSFTIIIIFYFFYF